MHDISKIGLAVLMFWSLQACQNGAWSSTNDTLISLTSDSCNGTDFIVEDFTINILPAEMLSYHNKKNMADDLLTRKRNFDKDSIPVTEKYGKLVYFPSNMIQYCFAILDELVIAKQDTNSLKTIDKVVDKLIAQAERIDSSLMIAYRLDYPLHGDRSGEVIKNPWYSSLAQGQMISLMMRMYEFTNDSTYLDIGRSCFNTYRKIKGKGASPWFSCIDENNHIWFEEYPRELPCLTLNGKIFAIVGLYDYYRITGDEEAKHYLLGGLTTIKNNIERFRVENECSYYCLKHAHCKVQYRDYHILHIEQLQILYEITGDTYFSDMSALFASDTPPSKK